jgi:hypothetical protein
MATNRVDSNEDSFTINVTGTKTGTNYAGKFTAKIYLSFADELARDNLRRFLLGPSPGVPTERIANMADLLSEVAVRVNEGPSWFIDSDRGQTLKDEPLQAIYKECIAVSQKPIEEMKAKAAEAKKNLAAQDEVVA